jgi:hypothetical protein
MEEAIAEKERHTLQTFSTISNQFITVKIDSNSLVKLIQAKSESGFNLLYNSYPSALYGIILKTC